MLIANRRHTDLFEWGQRTTPFSLAAEIQRRLLPAAFTCEAGQFTVSGWLEPAATVGGDTFDWSLDRHSLQVSVTDAVGHDVAAALLATLLVGSLRNERRRGVDLGAQAGAANDAVARHGAPGQFVTGQVLRIDLPTGRAQVVNAGLTLTLSAGTTIENVIGGALGDALTGNALNNVITGGAGSDTLDGGAGTDTLDGGAGTDVGINGEVVINIP